jgi:hypothetical protein
MDFINIDRLVKGSTSYHIHDSAGKVVGSGKYDGPIDISRLAPGQYYLSTELLTLPFIKR